MAMQPFCGYNYADYWQHWLNVGAKLKESAKDLPRELVPPRRTWQVPVAGLWRQPARAGLDAASVGGTSGATDMAIGALPRPQDLNLKGLDITPAALDELLRVDPAQWRKEVGELRKYLGQYGSRLPPALTQNLDTVEKALG